MARILVALSVASASSVARIFAACKEASVRCTWATFPKVPDEPLGTLENVPHLFHSVQPLRYSVWTYWFSSGAFLTFRFSLSHSSRVPGARRASTPSSTVSVIGPE